jgi:hypothetical protein
MRRCGRKLNIGKFVMYFRWMLERVRLCHFDAFVAMQRNLFAGTLFASVPA